MRRSASGKATRKRSEAARQKGEERRREAKGAKRWKNDADRGARNSGVAEAAGRG